MKELDEAWSALPGDPAVPTRLLRSQQQSQAAAVVPTGGEGGGQEGGVVPVVEAVDPYEFLDPVDMLEQMPKDFYEQLVMHYVVVVSQILWLYKISSFSCSVGIFQRGQHGFILAVTRIPALC